MPPMSEKEAKLAQKLGQLQPFIAAFPLECMGQPTSPGPTRHVSRYGQVRVGYGLQYYREDVRYLDRGTGDEHTGARSPGPCGHFPADRSVSTGVISSALVRGVARSGLWGIERHRPRPHNRRVETAARGNSPLPEEPRALRAPWLRTL
jgi:hypothetical protein